jgi:hypothetical protein
MARAFDIKDYAYDPKDAGMNLVLTNRINESRHPQLFRNLIAEFCNTFNTKVVRSDTEYSNMGLMYNGFLIGDLSVSTSYEEGYCYRSDMFIGKERGARRTTRESGKLSTLIRTVKKKEEFPTQERIQKHFSREISSVVSNNLESPRSTRYAPTIEASSELLLALVELVVNKLPLTNEYETKARFQYEAYLKKKDLRSSSMKAADRFKQGGFYVLGVTPKSSYVAEMAFENNALVYKTQLTVVTEDELQSRPEIAVPMTFAKVYFETHKGSGRLYSLPMVDEYVDELDICIGYQNSNTTWALIPKVSDTTV